MKIFQAIKQIEFAFKLLAAAGFTGFETAFAAKNETALKAHLDQAIATAKPVEKIVEKVIEPTDEQLTALVTAELREQATAAGFTLAADADPIAAFKTAHATFTALQSQHTLVLNSLASCGIKLVAADPKAGLTAPDISKALQTRVSLKAAELTALLGTAPVATQVAASPTTAPAAAAKSQATELTGLARTQAALEAQRAK